MFNIGKCKPKKVIEEKGHQQPGYLQPWEDCQAKFINEFGGVSPWVDWGWSLRIKSYARTKLRHGLQVTFLVSSTYRTRDNVRRVTSVLRRRTGLALWSKVLFSDESKVYMSFGNQGLKVWGKSGEVRHPRCLSVKFPQSVIICVHQHTLPKLPTSG